MSRPTQIESMRLKEKWHAIIATAGAASRRITGRSGPTVSEPGGRATVVTLGKLPERGPGGQRATAGDQLLTVIVIPAEVVVWPAASRAMAVSVYVPFGRPCESDASVNFVIVRVLIDAEDVVLERQLGRCRTPLIEAAVAGSGACEDSVHRLQSNQRVLDRDDVIAAVLGCRIRPRGKPDEAAVQQRVVDRAGEHEVILDAAVTRIVDVGTSQRPVRNVLAECDPVATIERANILDDHVGAVRHHGIVCGRAAPGSRRRQVADAVAA